jgi:uncharacterized protein YjbI with pentapeptide repeats
MLKQPIVQPLPHNLQNWSFKGLDCSGWDFSGRDIRGCNFLGSNLHHADFSNCTAGRSQQQINREITMMILGAIVGAIGILIILHPIGIQTYSNATTDAMIYAVGDANRAAILRGSVLGFIMWGLFCFVGTRLSILSMMTMFMTVPLTLLLDIAVSTVNLGLRSWIDILFLAVIIFCAIVFCFFNYKNVIAKEFKNTIGTSFQGANLNGLNFTDALLNNCSFQKADTSDITWTNAAIDRCQGLKTARLSDESPQN